MKKILFAFSTLLLFASTALAQENLPRVTDSLPMAEQSHTSFSQKARDAILLRAMQDSNPYARRFQPRASDPSSPPNGTVWYRSDTDVVKVQLNSGVKTLQTGATAPGGSNGQIQYNNSGAFGGLDTVPVGNGGTGQSSYTNGQLLIGNTTGNTLTKATLTQGSNITITNGGGSITIAAASGGIGGWSDTTARTVGASSTQYLYPLNPGAASNSTETNRQNRIPSTFTFSNLYITTISTQGNDGALTCTIRVNGSTDSSLSVAISANAVAGTFSDTTHSVSLSAADLISLKCVNASASTSAGISEVRFLTVKN
jgi:hypothetical protein